MSCPSSLYHASLYRPRQPKESRNAQQMPSFACSISTCFDPCFFKLCCSKLWACASLPVYFPVPLLQQSDEATTNVSEERNSTLNAEQLSNAEIKLHLRLSSYLRDVKHSVSSHNAVGSLADACVGAQKVCKECAEGWAFMSRYGRPTCVRLSEGCVEIGEPASF